MNMIRLVLLAGLSVFVSSCASMMKDWQDTNCNYDAAYAAGMQEYQNGAQQKTNQYAACEGPSRNEALKGYREGYAKAMESDGSRSAPVGGGGNRGGININIGGHQTVGGADPRAARRFFCEVSAFTNHYEAFGPTRLEARQAAENQCKTQNNAMHCQNVNCRENR